MKTIVVCAIFCLELVFGFPYPEPLPGYYETYEPVPQQIQLPNVARSPDLYHQQQLAYIQQQHENIRRQNYEHLLRNQNLNQRLSNQILQPNYNIQSVLNTVHEPYVNSISLQPAIHQTQYETPMTQQYYPAQVQSVQQPIRQYQPVQSQQYEETGSEALAETGTQAQINNPYPQQQYPGYNERNLAYHPRIQQVLASTPLQKRYLVLHPNGTIEHIDKIEHIVEQHPNYILVNAGSVAPKPNEPIVATAQSPFHQQQPVAPASSASVVPATAVAQANAIPASPAPALVAPVAPLTPVVPATASAQANAVPSPETPASVDPVVPATSVGHANDVPESLAPAPVVPAASIAQANAVPESPTPATAVAQANDDPASPVASDQVPAPVNGGPVAPVAPDAPSAPPTPDAPVPIIQNGIVPDLKPAPIAQPPVILNGTVPGPKPTVPPATGPTTTLPPVSAQTAQPPVLLNGSVPGPTTLIPTTPIWITATATAVYPPPTTPLPPTILPLNETPVPPTVTPVTPLPPTATPIPPVTATTTATATSAPAVTTTSADTEAPDSPTTVAPYTKPSDPSTDLDVLHVNTGTEPVVWFRTKDLDFWNKLTNGKETYDVIYFFNVPREPRVMKETTTTINADGTVVEEITQTIYDDEDGTPPRVIKTTKITKPDGTQSNT